ncbi:hypothetical protein SEA_FRANKENWEENIE_280 [Streptomyces phage Frankenweenie]|nr:hypothetical protein SEA_FRANKENWEENIE_280 [Streptomyces phage Frankenweenie]
MEFPEKFSTAAADTDYSRYPQLQALSKYDILATAEALRLTAIQLGTHVRGWVMLRDLPLDEPTVTTALLAQKQRWDDEGHLVSTEFEEYWDATDTHNFPSSLLEEMKRHLVRQFLEGKKAEHVVVDNPYGIWLFDKAVLEGVFR